MYQAEEIRVAMARKNLKINDVVDKSGLSRETVSLIVNGQAENPTITSLEKVGNAVGLSFRVEWAPLSEVLVVAEQ